MTALTARTIVLAARMGARAGLAWRDTGVPSRNPFAEYAHLAELAAVFNRAYFHAAAVRP